VGEAGEVVASAGGEDVGGGDAAGEAGVDVMGSVGCPVAGSGVYVGLETAGRVAVGVSGVFIGGEAVWVRLGVPWVGDTFTCLEQEVSRTMAIQKVKK